MGGLPVFAWDFPENSYNQSMDVQHVAAQAAFLACGMVTIGLILSIIGAFGARMGRASLRWSSTPGQVQDSRVAWDPLSGRYQARVRYIYTVNGQEHQAERVSFRQGLPLAGPRGALAREEAARYSPEQPVAVYYDPADPSRAVLEPGADHAAMILLGVGGLFFVIGLMMGIVGLVLPFPPQ